MEMNEVFVFFFEKWKETADLVTFTEEILNGKLHFLCSDCCTRIDFL